MAVQKIRMLSFQTGVLDGEHYPRAFIKDVCYALATGEDGEPVKGSLLDVFLTESWAAKTEKGTPAEPELMVDASPAAQRLMADAAYSDAKVAALEAHDAAHEAVAMAEAAEKAAEEAAKVDVEGEAAKAALAHAKELRAAADAKLAALAKA